MAKALPILKLTEKSFQINTENFKSVLSKVGHRPFAVISINGTTRTGKSFILSHFVRYFESKKRDPWCTKWYENANCANFEWQSGIDRTTTGINLWSEPYFVKTRGGEEIAVLLLDTQGLFDPESTPQQNVTIFAISTLCSSVMVFNIMQTLDEKTLQDLEFFSGYAHLARAKPNEAQNQNGRSDAAGESSYKHGSHLQFLIRDFQLPAYGFGAHTNRSNPPGKKNLFKDLILLNGRSNVAAKNRTVRETILNGFKEVSMYSLPHPGPAFTTQEGKEKAPDVVFKDHVTKYVEYMVEEGNLVKKTVFDKTVSGFEFLNYIDNYSKLCENAGEMFPEVRTVADSACFVT